MNGIIGWFFFIISVSVIHLYPPYSRSAQEATHRVWNVSLKGCRCHHYRARKHWVIIVILMMGRKDIKTCCAAQRKANQRKKKSVIGGSNSSDMNIITPSQQRAQPLFIVIVRKAGIWKFENNNEYNARPVYLWHFYFFFFSSWGGPLHLKTTKDGRPDWLLATSAAVIFGAGANWFGCFPDPSISLFFALILQLWKAFRLINTKRYCPLRAEKKSVWTSVARRRLTEFFTFD